MEAEIKYGVSNTIASGTEAQQRIILLVKHPLLTKHSLGYLTNHGDSNSIVSVSLLGLKIRPPSTLKRAVNNFSEPPSIIATRFTKSP